MRFLCRLVHDRFQIVRLHLHQSVVPFKEKRRRRGAQFVIGLLERSLSCANNPSRACEEKRGNCDTPMETKARLNSATAYLAVAIVWRVLCREALRTKVTVRHHSWIRRAQVTVVAAAIRANGALPGATRSS